MNRYILLGLLTAYIPGIAFAGESFYLSMMENNRNDGCILLTQSYTPKRYETYNLQKAKFDNSGVCRVIVPFNEGINFCALSGINNTSNATQPYCSAFIRKFDEKNNPTYDKSKWSIEFASKRGADCSFICVEN